MTASPSGTCWLYSTGDTERIGILLKQATGKTPIAYWDLTPSVVERAGGGLSITLRDCARFGQVILDGAKLSGR